jgi:spore coat protein U-like protein
MVVLVTVSAMRWTRGALTALVVMLLAAGTAAAASSASSFAVSASVVAQCAITTTPLSFGTYDPIVANKTAPLDATGSVTITCTQGAAATIGLDPGTNGAFATGTTRAMKTGSNYLSYEIYQNSGRTTVWGNAGGGLLTPAAAPSFAPRAFTIYGRIPAGRDVPAGSLYTDTVRATVNF